MKQRSSIKVKLIFIPLLVVFLGISGIAVVSTYFTRDSLLREMKQGGLDTTEVFVSRIEDNARSLRFIHAQFDHNIRGSANTVKLNQNNLSNSFLTLLARQSDIDVINYYNSKGEIVFSNMGEYIGVVASAGDPAYEFMKSGEAEHMAEIVQASGSDVFYKYGYSQSYNGEFIQVGMSADRIQSIIDDFDTQGLLEDLALGEYTEYAMFVGTDLVVTAHSNKDEIGITLDDAGSKAAAIDGVPYADLWDSDELGMTVYDVCYPVVIDGEHIGAVSVGYSMGPIQSAIWRNIIIVMTAGALAFLLLGLTLYKSSSDVIKIINRLKEQMGFLASGDFTHPVPDDLTTKDDELGEISRAVATMQASVKSAVTNAIQASGQLGASSQELAATSQQSASAADEVAKVIEDIAHGAASQAEQTGYGVRSTAELGDLIMKNKDYIESLNSTTEKVDLLKDEGLSLLTELVEATTRSNKASSSVQSIIINTNESAGQIASASQMIQNITDQTNLLALNAAIEAARAGEAGRGFAVVADEIRKLAEESSQFTGEINKVITDLTDKTSSAVRTMEEVATIMASQSDSVQMTNNKFDGIAQAIEQMKQIIHDVSVSGDDMATKEDYIISVMEQLSAISQENAAGAQEASASVEEQSASTEEIAHSSEDLARIAEDLNVHMSKFRV